MSERGKGGGDFFFWRIAKEAVDMNVCFWTVAKIVELEKDKESIVIGTLYKEMKLKPQILDEYLKTPGLDEGRVNFTAEDDKLVLEDESGRVVIESACLQTDHLVTGCGIRRRRRRRRRKASEMNHGAA